MLASKIALISCKISTLEASSSLKQVSKIPLLSLCTLKWRQEKLWVSHTKLGRQLHLPALNSEQWLKRCLCYSPVKAVCLDPRLGEMRLNLWANICHQVNKRVFLRIPSTPKLPQKQSVLSWRVKRVTDCFAAVVLLLILSPVMLGIAGLIQVFSPGPIFFKQWRVGKRGQLFQIIKFRTMIVDAEKLHYRVMGNQKGLHKRKDDPRITPLGRWLRKYSLDELPQLINVLQGEMSLVGPRPWALYDAIRISPIDQRRLNALPGITGAWQLQARSTLLDLEAVNHCDLNYLDTWSLWQDLKILVLTIPKVLSGFGAY